MQITLTRGALQSPQVSCAGPYASGRDKQDLAYDQANLWHLIPPFELLGHSWDMAFPGRREGSKPCLHFFYKNKDFIHPMSHPACPNVALWVPQHFSLKRLRTLSNTALRGKAIPTLNVRISISYSLMGLDLHFAGREPDPCSTQERSLPLNRSTFLFKKY